MRCGFAAILVVLQEAATKSGHKISAKRRNLIVRCCLMRGGKIKTPPVLGQRATNYRGTTSCSPPPHGKRPRRVLTHPIAVTGEPDTSLLTSKFRLSEGCSGMYSHAPPSPLFTSQRFSLQAPGRVTSSLHHGNGIKLPLL